ncbi:MAG: hypothetical protein KDB80_01170 [Planctomycetes bacterium]|nr:hypothetical protein [Planctomycetota bacterium]
MTREVHRIPPAPRRSVRWSTALWNRWPFALFGFLFSVYGGLITLMLTFHAAGKPSDDRALDAGALTAEAKVLDVVPGHAVLPSGAHAVQVHYSFSTSQHELFGKSFAAEGVHAGDRVTVEYLAERPEVNRVADGRLYLLADWATPAFTLTVVPGVLFWVIWFVGVLRMRALLVHGDVAVAKIHSVAQIPWVVPSMLLARFSFLDRNAHGVAGRHWVRERSSLGERLLTNPDSLAVVHDRKHPWRHRLIIPEEFAKA